MATESIKMRIISALVGFAIAILLGCVDSGSVHNSLDAGLMAAYVILCPPFLLSVPFFFVAFEAAEYGTLLYFAIWGIVALLNAGLYAMIGPPIIDAIRRNWDFTHE